VRASNCQVQLIKDLSSLGATVLLWEQHRSQTGKIARLDLTFHERALVMASSMLGRRTRTVLKSVHVFMAAM
jgi:hypothetical protein